MLRSLSRGDRMLLLAAGAVLVAIVGVAFLLASGRSGTSEIPESDATGSGGGKAAFLLLGESGYDVARWERQPADLTDAARTTLIVAGPTEFATQDDQAAIARFLHAGGRLIATGVVGAWMLGVAASPHLAGASIWSEAIPVAPSPIAHAASAISLVAGAEWPALAPAVPLYQVDDHVVVAARQEGAGTAFWWASATPLTNAGLKASGNLEFFLASVGPPGERRVLWDEYFHGRRESLPAAVLHSSAKWVVVQIAIVAAAIVWTFARRSGPIVAPVAVSRLAPLEFVRTLGGLFQQAGAATMALDTAEQRARDRLSRRFAVPARAEAAMFDRAVAGAAAEGDASLARALAAIEHARQTAPVSPARALDAIQRLTAAVNAVDPPAAWTQESAVDSHDEPD